MALPTGSCRRVGMWRGLGWRRLYFLVALMFLLDSFLNQSGVKNLFLQWRLSTPIVLESRLRRSCFLNSGQQGQKMSTFLLVVVKSAPKNWHRRSVLRNTWLRSEWGWSGSWITSCHYRAFFVVGQSKLRLLDRSVAVESVKHKDMWLSGIHDTYFRLRRKLVWSFSFAMKHFQFSYFMSADDDSFVNMPALLHWLAPQPRQLFYGGALVVNGKVERSPSSKWAVDNETYADDVYPPYMYGSGYVLSVDLVQLLAKEKSYDDSVQKMWLDDVLVGMVLHQRLPDLQPKHSGHFYGFLSHWPKACEGVDSVMIGNVPIMKMVRYYKNVKAGRSLC